MNSDFSAAASALGYLHQIRYALFLLLNSEEEAAISIESIDDVVILENSKTKPYQLKRHGQPAPLRETSVDFWKTLRVWIDAFTKGKIDINNTICTLITTSHVDPGSVLTGLKAKNKIPNLNTLIETLDSIAAISKNKELEAAYFSYLALPRNQKEALIKAIQIIDSSLDVQEIPTQIKRDKFWYSVPDTKFIDSFYDSIEGWWMKTVIHHLVDKSELPIFKFVLDNKIRDTIQYYRPDNLPIDFLSADPPEAPNPEGDTRLFVEQLRVITLSNEDIDMAIRDYYRAFVQKSKWVRQGLLNDGELERYEQRLVEEWKRELRRQSRKIVKPNDPQELINCGLNIFDWMELDSAKMIEPIRHEVTEPYVRRGIFHHLADIEPQPKVYWHPNFLQHPSFLERLKSLLTLQQE